MQTGPDTDLSAMRHERSLVTIEMAPRQKVGYSLGLIAALLVWQATSTVLALTYAPRLEDGLSVEVLENLPYFTRAMFDTYGYWWLVDLANCAFFFASTRNEAFVIPAVLSNAAAAVAMQTTLTVGTIEIHLPIC